MKWMIPLSILVLTGCSAASEPTESDGKSKTVAGNEDAKSLPQASQKPARWELRKDERYFRLNRMPTLVLGRNPAGTNEQFQEAFRHGAASGERLMRIHLTHAPPMKSKAGEVDEAWSKRWEQIFDMAAKNGMGVIPVFGVTPCRKQWLAWLEAMVTRWRKRKEIIAWEVFSELDLLTPHIDRNDHAAECHTGVGAGIRAVRNAVSWSNVIWIKPSTDQVGVQRMVWRQLVSSNARAWVMDDTQMDLPAISWANANSRPCCSSNVPKNASNELPEIAGLAKAILVVARRRPPAAIAPVIRDAPTMVNPQASPSVWSLAKKTKRTIRRVVLARHLHVELIADVPAAHCYALVVHAYLTVELSHSIEQKLIQWHLRNSSSVSRE